MSRCGIVEKVSEFHRVFGHPVSQPITAREIMLRTKLIGEETREVNAAMLDLYMGKPSTEVGLENLAKELADLIYVVVGAAVSFGIPLTAVFNRVHDSNMSKLGDDGKPVYSPEGKVLKGPNYKPPVLSDLVRDIKVNLLPEENPDER